MKTRKSTKGLLAASICAAIGMAELNIVMADESARLEEVFVTARKTTENQQTIPESITAFGSDAIESAKIEKLVDFVNLTPNLTVRETFRSNETFLSLRGINSPQGGFPAVSFVVDGVQLPGNDFVNQDLMDIESISVLKGPQGALFGQGAIAGAISIETKKPSSETEGFIKASYGNGESYRIAAGVSGPIIEDTLLYRVTGYTRDRSGLIKNDTINEYVDYSESDSLRAALYYQGDNLTVDFNTSFTDSEAGAIFLDKITRDGNGGYIDILGNSVDIDDVDSSGPLSGFKGYEETEAASTSLRLEYQFDSALLTSVTGFGSTDQLVFGDGDFRPVAAVGQDIAFEVEYFNQELRLASDNDGPLNWIVGAFYQSREEKNILKVGFEDSATPEFDFNSVIINQDIETEADSWAVFGQVEYEVNDRTILSASLRYDEIDASSIDKNFPASAASETFDEVQPKVQLSYDFTDDVMGYVTLSKGFRQGGFTQNDVFTNEVTNNYEFGFKSTLADGRAFLNMSFFRVDYTDQQVSVLVFDNGQADRAIVNVPEVEIYGLEVDATVLATDNLKLTFAAGVTETTIIDEFVETSSSLAPNPGNVKGNESPLTAPFTFNLGANYTVPVSDTLDLEINANYRVRGGYYYDLANQDKNDTAEFVSITSTLKADNWSFGIWGKNLTDTRYATNLTASLTRTPNMPRTYGISASYNF